MEFNQDNRSFCTTVAVLDTVAEQLADVDLTLPDYCPDIEKILKCTLIPKIQTRTLSGGQLQIDGSCVVNVLYVDSIKKSIRCCEQSVNFSQSFSVKESPDRIHKLSGAESTQTGNAWRIFAVRKGAFFVKNTVLHSVCRKLS